jgi:hypothetical protein
MDQGGVLVTVIDIVINLVPVPSAGRVGRLYPVMGESGSVKIDISPLILLLNYVYSLVVSGMFLSVFYL